MEQLNFPFMEEILEKESKLESKKGLSNMFLSGVILLSSFVGIYEGSQYLSTEVTSALEPAIEILNSFQNLYK